MATREVGLPALPGAPGGKAWACTVTASWDELDAWLASALCAAQRGSPGTQASKRKRTAAGAGKGLVPVGGASFRRTATSRRLACALALVRCRARTRAVQKAPLPPTPPPAR